MIKNVMFDLDGTLLPFDLEAFMKFYLGSLSKDVMHLGYEPKELINNILKGTYLMIKNDGSMTNKEVFWNFFESVYGKKVYEDEKYFDRYYETTFKEGKKICNINPKAVEVIKTCKELGFNITLATNPIFPKVATYERLSWTGIDKDNFNLITTYENSRYSKPNLNYFKDIMNKLNYKADETLMVGNDVSEDMVVKDIGVSTFLLTDCLINSKNLDYSCYNQGNMDDLINFLKGLNK